MPKSLVILALSSRCQTRVRLVDPLAPAAPERAHVKKTVNRIDRIARPRKLFRFVQTVSAATLHRQRTALVNPANKRCLHWPPAAACALLSFRGDGAHDPGLALIVDARGGVDPVLDQSIEPVEIEINDRGDVKRQQLRHSNPPTTATPSGWRNSDPAPVPSAIGSAPKIAAHVVIMIGRKRNRHASRIASAAGKPTARR